MATKQAAAAAKERHAAELMQIPHVIGVGTTVAEGEWLVQIHIDHGQQVSVPESLDGVPVSVVPDGPIVAGPARAAAPEGSGS